MVDMPMSRAKIDFTYDDKGGEKILNNFRIKTVKVDGLYNPESAYVIDIGTDGSKAVLCFCGFGNVSENFVDFSNVFSHHYLQTKLNVFNFFSWIWFLNG